MLSVESVLQTSNALKIIIININVCFALQCIFHFKNRYMLALE